MNQPHMDQPRTEHDWTEHDRTEHDRTASSSRWASLDVLRGLAILGTFATNIWIFTNVDGLIGYIEGRHLASGTALTMQLVLQQLAQGKFLGLLAIMFGIGIAIQQRSAIRRGRPWPGGYPWRAALLFVDGAVNYVLFTEFDVLMGYAVTGLIVAYLLVMRATRRRVVIGVAIAVHLAILVVAVVALTGPAVANTGRGEALSPNPYADASFVGLAVFRIENLAFFRFETVVIIPLTIVLFWAGVALLGAGILEPRGQSLRRRLMILGFGVALPADMVLGSVGGAAGLVIARYSTAPLVSLGLLAAVAGFYSGCRTPGVIGRALTPVGRTALSCYVLQNALAGAVCYGWGLGLAARLTSSTIVPATVMLYLAICATLMLASRAWLTRFDRGPLELLSHRAYATLAGDRPRRAATG